MISVIADDHSRDHSLYYKYYPCWNNTLSSADLLTHQTNLLRHFAIIKTITLLESICIQQPVNYYVSQSGRYLEQTSDSRCAKRRWASACQRKHVTNVAPSVPRLLLIQTMETGNGMTYYEQELGSLHCHPPLPQMFDKGYWRAVLSFVVFSAQICSIGTLEPHSSGDTSLRMIIPHPHPMLGWNMLRQTKKYFFTPSCN